jgi:polyhydroxyalkanoate synthase
MTKKRMETAVDLGLADHSTPLPDPAGEALTQSLAASQALMNSLAGRSEVKRQGRQRFRDPVWASNPAYKILMEAYLAWSGR